MGKLRQEGYLPVGKIGLFDGQNVSRPFDIVGFGDFGELRNGRNFYSRFPVIDYGCANAYLFRRLFVRQSRFFPQRLQPDSESAGKRTGVHFFPLGTHNWFYRHIWAYLLGKISG